MSKEFGLIEKKSKKISKPAAFDSDSSSDDGGRKTISLEPGETQKRQARLAQEKAVSQDPTIYQYDELYDDMDLKRKEAKSDKSKEEKKPKYIGKLLETAEKRKKEQERRIERQVQKEREAEGEMFKDKESFVTSAYREKLEEMKKAEEDEKREEYLETIGDVTKQGDLGGFYRHIYSQKMGDEKEKEKAKSEKLEKEKQADAKSRKYRKRKSEEEDGSDNDEKKDGKKKTHLQSNLDADSDFSIDSQSESDSNSSSEDDKRKVKKQSKDEKKDLVKKEVKEEKPEQNGTETKNKSDGKEKLKSEDKKAESKPKKPKVDIWKKRTIGNVFDEAVQRYYERKAARNSG